MHMRFGLFFALLLLQAVPGHCTEVIGIDESQLSAKVAELLGPAPEDRARVVVYRPKSFKGAFFSFWIREQETNLAKSKNGQYLVLELSPGAHTLEVRAEGFAQTTLSAQAGYSYFYRMEIEQYISQPLTGTGNVRLPYFKPSSAEEFEAALPKLKAAGA